jgi:hypothetical protein
MRTDGRSDSHDERNNIFSEIWEARNIVQFILFLKYAQDTLIWIEGTQIENDVTVVVSGYNVVFRSPIYCKMT